MDATPKKMVPKSPKMFVLKRGGQKEPVMFDKITSRIQKLCYGLDMDFLDPPAITLKVINGVYSGVTTVELDNIASEIAIMMTNEHPDYAVLAARLAISNLHKETSKSFSDVTELLRNNKDKKYGISKALVSEKYYEAAVEHADELNSAIIHDRDFSFSYFGFKELVNNFLLKINNKPVERPQQMWMRVALSIHGNDVANVIKTYNLLSEKWYIHDPSTILKAGFPNGQLARAFSLTMQADSIEGICDSLEECGTVARSGGEVGLNIHCIRATGTYIAGTNGVSTGLVPMLRVFNDVAVFVHQGGTKNHAKITIYVEPWHADIYDFVNLKKNNGKDEQRARVLAYGLWIPDLFMKRVEQDGVWSLMCPHKCPGLSESWGEKFEDLYMTYEKESKFKKQVKARELWFAILDCQMENGSPYIVYKDACNRKSNHQNVGTILCANYSTEYVGYTSSEQTSASHGASISLEMFVTADKKFDFEKLKQVTKDVTFNLNTLIDANNYPSDQCQLITKQLRPMSIGVLGLADTFIQMRLPFDSAEAETLNKHIFETIYYGALEASAELCEDYSPYDFFEGSPSSQGVLQFDMWDVIPSKLHDWQNLKEKIKTCGLRNSVLVGLMPTRECSQILANSESFEALQSNIVSRNLEAGQYSEINKHLLRDLTELGLWDKDMEDQLIEQKGSIQGIKSIPDSLKQLYKTTWEISQKVVIKMANDRAPYVDQSQSLNLHLAAPNFGKLNAIHFSTWHSGLKTGIHQLRTRN